MENRIRRNAPGDITRGPWQNDTCFRAWAILIFLSSFAVWLAAQDAGQDNGGNVIRVVVSMVQLNVAVTDEQGKLRDHPAPLGF